MALGDYMIWTSLAPLWGTFTWGLSDNSFIFLPFEAGLIWLAAATLLLLGSTRVMTGPALPLKALARSQWLPLAAALVIVVWFIWRGPGDWASGSQEVRLFSFPIVIDAIILGGIVFHFSR